MGSITCKTLDLPHLSKHVILKIAVLAINLVPLDGGLGGGGGEDGTPPAALPLVEDAHEGVPQNGVVLEPVCGRPPFRELSLRCREKDDDHV